MKTFHWWIMIITRQNKNNIRTSNSRSRLLSCRLAGESRCTSEQKVSWMKVSRPSCSIKKRQLLLQSVLENRQQWHWNAVNREKGFFFPLWIKISCKLQPLSLHSLFISFIPTSINSCIMCRDVDRFYNYHTPFMLHLQNKAKLKHNENLHLNGIDFSPFCTSVSFI